jgi:hypothetical protein
MKKLSKKLFAIIISIVLGGGIVDTTILTPPTRSQYTSYTPEDKAFVIFTIKCILELPLNTSSLSTIRIIAWTY